MMETPDIAADETALQELKFGQGKAHRTTLKPLHWKEKKKKFCMSFIFDRKYKEVTPQLQGWPLHTFQK